VPEEDLGARVIVYQNRISTAAGDDDDDDDVNYFFSISFFFLWYIILSMHYNNIFATTNLKLAIAVAGSNMPVLKTETTKMDPKFNGTLQNVTATVGRRATLSCTIENLGAHKVSSFVLN
jgi:hypothetical protein